MKCDKCNEELKTGTGYAEEEIQHHECKTMNQPTLKTIIGEEKEKLLKMNGEQFHFLEAEFQKVVEFWESSISSAIKKAFEATAVEKLEHIDLSPRYVDGVDKWGGDYVADEMLRTLAFNAALAEKRQKEINFLTS